MRSLVTGRIWVDPSTVDAHYEGKSNIAPDCIDPNPGHRPGDGAAFQPDRQLEGGNRFPKWGEPFFPPGRSRCRERFFSAAWSKTGRADRAIGCRVDSERRPFSQRFRAGAIPPRQRRSPPRNAGLERKIWNRRLDHGRRPFFSERAGSKRPESHTVKERHVQRGPGEGLISNSLRRDGIRPPRGKTLLNCKKKRRDIFLVGLVASVRLRTLSAYRPTSTTSLTYL